MDRMNASKPARSGPAGAALVAFLVWAVAGGAVCQPVAQKLCVREAKKNTRVCYSCVCKEYCLPKCSLWALFSGGCCGGCELRTKRVLVKKVRPDCDTTQCVVKEVPVDSAAPA